MARFTKVAIIVGFAASNGKAGEQTSIIAFDKQRTNVAYSVKVSNQLSNGEIYRLKSVLSSQDLEVLDNDGVHMFKKFGRQAHKIQSTKNTSDLTGFIKSITGLDTKVSEVNIHAMVYSTQENIE